jgi:hypothetical protein
VRKYALSVYFVSLVHMTQIETIGVVLPKVAKVSAPIGILAKVFVVKFAKCDPLIKKTYLCGKVKLNIPI